MSRQQRASLITVIVAVVVGVLIALAGSQGGATFAGVPLFALAVALAFAIQVLVYIPSAIAKTERFFDLTGSATFVAISVALLVASPNPDARSYILAAMVALWAVRLGTFLVTRIRRAGEDDRFAEIKQSKIRFLRVWITQALWVSLTASGAWIAISSSSDDRAPIGWLSIVGVLIWVAGMAIEITADVQKTRFKADARNEGQFIRTGLWSRSRHPNYFGEILLWVGVTLVAVPVLEGWQWIALISPLFVILLLTRVSGIPLLEAKAERKWGDQADYRAYVASTPVLVPRLTRPTSRT